MLSVSRSFAVLARPLSALASSRPNARQCTIGVAMFIIALAVTLLVGAGAGLAFGNSPSTLSSLALSVELAPRLLRLGLVSLFALPALTLLVPRFAWSELTLLGKRLPPSTLGGLLVTGMFLMPTLLFGAALLSVHLKYLLAVPALSFTVAMVWVAVRAWALHPWRRETVAWTALALSLVLGLTLGLFAFDGPMPVPSILSDYTTPLRKALRSSHHLSVTLSILQLAWCRFRRERQSPQDDRKSETL